MEPETDDPGGVATHEFVVGGQNFSPYHDASFAFPVPQLSPVLNMSTQAPRVRMQMPILPTLLRPPSEMTGVSMQATRELPPLSKPEGTSGLDTAILLGRLQLEKGLRSGVVRLIGFLAVFLTILNAYTMKTKRGPLQSAELF